MAPGAALATGGANNKSAHPERSVSDCGRAVARKRGRKPGHIVGLGSPSKHWVAGGSQGVGRSARVRKAATQYTPDSDQAYYHKTGWHSSQKGLRGQAVQCSTPTVTRNVPDDAAITTPSVIDKKRWDQAAKQRVSVAQGKKRKHWAHAQSQHRHKIQEEQKQHTAELHQAISQEMRLKRIEESTWRELRMWCVERFIEERAKPGVQKEEAYELVAQHCMASPRFVHAWVRRFFGKGRIGPTGVGNGFWAADKWGAHPKLRWQLQTEESRHDARNRAHNSSDVFIRQIILYAIGTIINIQRLGVDSRGATIQIHCPFTQDDLFKSTVPTH